MNDRLAIHAVFALGFAVLAAGCGRAKADDGAAPKPGEAPGQTSQPAPAAAADDPLADFSQIAASCDTSKKLGECVEYREVGLLGDSIKEMCTAIGGTFSATARCPADGRLAVCSVSEGGNKRFFYKPYFEFIKPDKAAETCKEIMLGTYKEYPKAKPAKK